MLFWWVRLLRLSVVTTCNAGLLWLESQRPHRQCPYVSRTRRFLHVMSEVTSRTCPVASRTCPVAFGNLNGRIAPCVHLLFAYVSGYSAHVSGFSLALSGCFTYVSIGLLEIRGRNGHTLTSWSICFEQLLAASGTCIKLSTAHHMASSKVHTGIGLR